MHKKKKKKKKKKSTKTRLKIFCLFSIIHVIGSPNLNLLHSVKNFLEILIFCALEIVIRDPCIRVPF